MEYKEFEFKYHYWLLVFIYLLEDSQRYPRWSPRDIQRLTALFHRFDNFQRCSVGIQKTWKTSALVQTWATLFFSESTLIRAKNFSAVAERISSESVLFSADFLSPEILGFQRWTELIYCESGLIITHVDENNKLW